MASGNRVEELESQIQELEATVEGLTDELVECKVRIRELENVVDVEVGLDNIGESDLETDVAGSADETEADTTKSEAAEDADNTESEDSDIIIA